MGGFRVSAARCEVVMASYPESNPFCHDRAQPAPLVPGTEHATLSDLEEPSVRSDISFENVHVSGPTQGLPERGTCVWRGPLVNFRGTEEVFMQRLGREAGGSSTRIHSGMKLSEVQLAAAKESLGARAGGQPGSLVRDPNLRTQYVAEDLQRPHQWQGGGA